MKHVVRCDICGKEWVVTAGDHLPKDLFSHYNKAHGFAGWEDSFNRFTIRFRSW